MKNMQQMIFAWKLHKKIISTRKIHKKLFLYEKYIRNDICVKITLECIKYVANDI